jgi:hypothetical protein
MALTFKLDEKQMQELRRQHAEQIQSRKDLSENLAKWLALLVGAITGSDDEDVQPQIDAHAAQVRVQREKLQTAINNQTQGE